MMDASIADNMSLVGHHRVRSGVTVSEHHAVLNERVARLGRRTAA